MGSLVMLRNLLAASHDPLTLHDVAAAVNGTAREDWRLDAPDKFIGPLLAGSLVSVVGFSLQMSACATLEFPAARNLDIKHWSAAHHTPPRPAHSELLLLPFHSAPPCKYPHVHGVRA